MPTITDSDASNPAVESVVTRGLFPFWLAVIELTGNALAGLDGEALNGVIILTPSAPQYIPGWAVLEGSASLPVVNGVAAPLLIPCTDCVSPSFTYTITQRLNTPDGMAGNPAPITGVSIPHSLGASVDISALL